MTVSNSLQLLYLQQVKSPFIPLESYVEQFLETPQTPFTDEWMEECRWDEPLFSEEIAHQNWKKLLAFNILSHLANGNQKESAAKVRFFEKHPWNQSSQYFRALVALNHAFANMPVPEVGPHLLESGAALIDLHEYCPWLSLPYHPQHLEFGLFLCLLALFTKRQDLYESIGQLAKWQLNLLDASGKPLTSLFVREKEGRTFQQLCLTYLFFRGAAAVKGDPLFGAVANTCLREIQEAIKKKENRIDPLSVLIEKWLEPFKMEGGAPILEEHIYDPSTALVGYRSAGHHVVCTLHGEHTGLGSYKYGGIEIVNYGPQYLPLGECSGFGIEGNALSDQGIRRSTIDWRPHTFSLKGCTRLVDQPSSTIESGKFRGIWMDVVQEFKKPHFYLKTSFLGIDGWDSVAFSFFIKAEKCKLNGEETFLPGTLKRYEGAAQTLLFEAKESSLELRPLTFKGTMQVIPLAGMQSFWGADFLISYPTSEDQRHYQWHIGPSNQQESKKLSNPL